MDPRIGILMKNNKKVYYAFLDGREREFQGTLAEVEAALGIHGRAVPLTRGREVTAARRAKPSKKRAGVRTFVVAVTPTVDHFSDPAYVVEVVAETHAKAIAKARRARVDEEGRLAIPCHYGAKLKRD